jgi:hypothetical protein
MTPEYTTELGPEDMADTARADKMRRYMQELEEAGIEDELSDTQHGFFCDMQDKFEKSEVPEFTDRQYGFMKGLWEQHCQGVPSRERKRRRR